MENRTDTILIFLGTRAFLSSHEKRLSYYYFLLHSIQEEIIRLVKIFGSWFLSDLHVLGCLEQDFTIFTKYPSVYDTNFVATYAQKTDEPKCIVSLYYNSLMIRFSCVSLRRFCYRSKFSILLTQRYSNLIKYWFF